MLNDKVKSTVVKLLNNIGSESEIRKYLKRFSDTDATSFAVIKVGGAVLQKDLDNLVSSLCFLQQVGLTPILVHGAGPQLNQKLDEHGIKSEFKDGRRVTTSDILHLARKVFIRENQKLVAALKGHGADAVSLTSGVFDCRLSKDNIGLVGEIKSVSLDLIENVISQGAIPIITPLGETDSGQIVNINADSATFALSQEIEPYKIIFLTEVGGILDEFGKIIPSISLQNDYLRLMQMPWLHSGMNFKLKQINEILKGLPNSSSVSITTPSLLAKELFTHKGSGTLVNKGEIILSYEKWQDASLEKISKLIESSFGKPLAEDYFQKTPLLKLYLTECNRGLIVISDEFAIPFLDKFTVSHSAKGEGIGSSLWNTMVEQHEQIFWRAKPNNPINQFYRQVADGFQKTQHWNVYWHGAIEAEQIPQCIAMALSKPLTVGVSHE